MDLLIKNMEMPKDGTLRLIIFPNGRVDEINIYNEACMSTDAQAVALPPHGDLIERSSVYNVLDDRVAFYKEAGDEYNACNIVCIEGDIATILTVLEASK